MSGSAQTLDEVVPDALAGERVDRVVALLADVSRTRAAELIASDAVHVNERVVSARSARLETGDRLVIEVPDDTPEPLVGDPDVAFEVLYEDADILVIDKPAGVVVHPGAGNPHATLCHGLLHRYPEIATVGQEGRPGIVHRLDKGTSGLLVVARSHAAYDPLVAMLSRHEVTREYRTFVWGEVGGPEGEIVAPIGRSQRDPTRMAVTPRGKPATTRYRVEEVFFEPGRTLLTCWLETGRTHQIRVHLTSIGHPVIGDTTYRGAALEGSDLRRPWLHAARVAFAHPVTDEPIEVTSPLPAELVVG